MGKLPLKYRIKNLFDAYFRMALWPVAALALLAFLDRPEQIDVLLYKGAMVTIAAWVGYWIDRHLFKYARPDEFLNDARLFNAATLRRAIIIAAVLLAFSIGI